MESEGRPDGSPAPMPKSSVVGRTPMLWKPTSCQRPSPISSTAPRVATLDTAASVNSGPLWQLVQPPFPVKRSMPRISSAVSVLRPSMYWSKRELLETSVDSYIWMATPQNMEKLYSIRLYSLVFCGVPVCRKFPLASTTALEFHHLDWNAAFTRSTYERFRPWFGAALSMPSTLSSMATSWLARGVTESIFLPILMKGRPVADISTSAPGGPTACEASAELVSRN